MTKVRRGEEEDVETGDRIDVEENNRDDAKEKRERGELVIVDVNDQSREVDVLHTVGKIRTDQGDAFEEQHARDLFVDVHWSMPRRLFLKNSNLPIGQLAEGDEKSNGKHSVETDDHYVEIVIRIDERMYDTVTDCRSIVIDRNGNAVQTGQGNHQTDNLLRRLSSTGQLPQPDLTWRQEISIERRQARADQRDEQRGLQDVVTKFTENNTIPFGDFVLETIDENTNEKRIHR